MHKEIIPVHAFYFSGDSGSCMRQAGLLNGLTVSMDIAVCDDRVR